MMFYLNKCFSYKYYKGEGPNAEDRGNQRRPKYGLASSRRGQVIAYANIQPKDLQDTESGGLTPTSFAPHSLA